MIRLLIMATLLVVMPAGLVSQRKSDDPRTRRLPDGRTQAQAIIEEDYKKSLEDAEELVKLSEELKEELEQHGHNVLSISAMRTAERIEELAKRIKNRMKRF